MKKLFIGFILSLIVITQYAQVNQIMMLRKHSIRNSILIPVMIIAVPAVNPAQSTGKTVLIIRSMHTGYPISHSKRGCRDHLY